MKKTGKNTITVAGARSRSRALANVVKTKKSNHARLLAAAAKALTKRLQKIPTQQTPFLDEPFSDSRGKIQNLPLPPKGLKFDSATVIHSTPNSIRAEHYHTDFHFSFVVSGAIEYFERPLGSSQTPERYLFSAGDAFFTPPGVEHAMRFHEATVFVTLNGGKRSHESYEKAVKRLDVKLCEVYDSALREARG